MKVMKIIANWWIVALIAIVTSVGISGCKKDRNNTPTPDPKPVPKELKLAVSLTNGGMIEEGKLVDVWTANDEVTIWGYAQNLSKPIELKAAFDPSKKWKFKNNLTDEWRNVERASIIYLPSGVYDSGKEVIKPNFVANKELESFLLSTYYEDVLIGDVGKVGEQILTTLNSPFKQVQLVLQNSQYNQSITDVSITIEGILERAEYHNGRWKGTSTEMTVRLKDKSNDWAGGERDELYIALPTNEKKVKATLTYNNSQGKQVIERELVFNSNAPTKLQFIFAEEPISNPPLAFNPPIDVAYWKKANQDAYNLVTSNLGTKYEVNEEFLRMMDFVVNRPLVDEAMHSRVLYKGDMNLIRWKTEAKTIDERNAPEWGFAYGLETLAGELVEVYPPTWQRSLSGAKGNMLVTAYSYASYHYVTVPAGKYRLVLFMSFPETWFGDKDKWYKIPLMDSLGGGETLNGMPPYDKRLHERVPMEKSAFKDIDIVEVVDRQVAKNTAPRWYMGYLFVNKEFYNRGEYINTDENWGTWRGEYDVGSVLGITAVNTTNQKLRGTIVAKAEYLPMYNSIGYERLEETAKYHRGERGKGGSYYYSSWSYEVGRIDVLLEANTESKVAIEITNWDSKSWEKNGGRGSTYMGPEYFVHFYWVDETGKETMMMRMDYPMMNKIQKLGWAYCKEEYNWYDVASQKMKTVPEGISVDFANGFLFM